MAPYGGAEGGELHRSAQVREVANTGPDSDDPVGMDLPSLFDEASHGALVGLRDSGLVHVVFPVVTHEVVVAVGVSPRTWILPDPGVGTEADPTANGALPSDLINRASHDELHRLETGAMYSGQLGDSKIAA